MTIITLCTFMCVYARFLESHRIVAHFSLIISILYAVRVKVGLIANFHQETT